MPKARLRYAIAIDAGLHRDGAADPVVHVYGSRHGTAAPFLVRRGWSGPQGAYVEQFRIVAADTRVTAYRSDPRIVELSGEYYSNDIDDRVEGVQLEVGEYELVFTVDDEVVPGVPVFVEPGPGAVGGPPALVSPIIDSATKKSDLVWISAPDQPDVSGQSTRPAWHIWHQGAVYLVFDGSEQRMPGLADADSAVVTVRSKDKGGTVVAWRAAVELVPPGSPAWDEVTPLLVGKRLNNRDGDAAPARWAKECRIARLVPTGELLEEPGRVRDDSRRESPPPTPASTETRVPITFHGRPRARRMEGS
ncbi:MAG TPA: hypothetical protein VNA12_09400 [Mycobacteriales bacterium]|nr:hypothetical protein [Mycobacteriales bacterium]